MIAVPESFDVEFLEWLRQVTERAWAKGADRPPNTPVEPPARGTHWQEGTRWTGGLLESEVVAVEEKNGFRFPTDYRLFLRHLHATDKPMVGARYAGSGMETVQRPGFFHWLRDEEAIRDALDGVLAGLLFDVETNRVWAKAWGRRPSSKHERETVVRAEYGRAPLLIPVFGHRFIVGGAGLSVNPILSAHQSDIIVYGMDLRRYLLNELGELIGLPRELGTLNGFDATTIPFWGDFLR